jgi:hypothetical protein
MGDRVLYFLRPLLSTASKGQSAQGWQPLVEVKAGEGRGQKAEKSCDHSQGAGMLQTPTPRGSSLCLLGNANEAPVNSVFSLAKGNLVPPCPAVAIGSEQSAVPSAASSSLPLPSFSPSLPLLRGLLSLSMHPGFEGAREFSLWKRERT